MTHVVDASALLAGSLDERGGDRVCLSLARLNGLPALTAGTSWAELDPDIDIHLIR